MRKILRIALLFMSLLICAGVRAQNQGTVIKGTVTDEKGVTLPGATVTVKGAKINAITDIDGNYSIQVPSAGKTLVFSFIGMESQEVLIGNRATINVKLLLTSNALADVVVIGYGTQKRQDVNGAISSVTAKDLANIPQPSVDQMLQGKAAGVTITQNSGGPGSATSVHIRGITSFGQSEPLYVIDGVPVQGDATNSPQLTRTGGGQEETGVSPLSLINPNDIESIDVLKDASATAIYGSRGANGVVIITTKRGKNGSAKINYDGYYGVQTQGKFIKMMDLQQYANLENVLADAFGIGRRGEFADPSILGPGTNWQRAIFKNAPQQSHTVSISGGKDGLDYYISGGYLKQEGTIIGSDFNRYSFRSTINSQVKSWFKVGGTISASRSNQNTGLGENTGLVYYALLSAPDSPVYNADGTYAGPAVTSNGTIQGQPNPVQQALSLTNNLIRNNVQGNIYGDLQIIKGLSLRSEISGNFNFTKAKTFQPTYSYGSTGSGAAYTNATARLNEYNTDDQYWDWNESLNYAHTFNKKHVLNLMAGREVWESNYDAVSAAISGFTAGNTLQTLGLGTQSSDLIGENKGTTVMESYLSRAIYTYDNKYSITASIRSDRSSNFAPGHQTGYFPGVAVSWRLSEEPFMAGIKSVADNVKIRVGYGTTGNSNIPGYRYGSAITPVSTGFGTGFIVGNIANPNLTWETAIQKNAGIDFSLFNNRIDGSFDVYQKTSKNFLFQQPLPAFLVGGVAEYSSAAVLQPPYKNAGEIENKGFEISLNSRNIQGRDFKWTTGIIFSKYNNKVVSLNGYPSLIGSENTSYVSLPVTNTTVGGPIGEFYGYKVQGIIKTTAQLQYLATHPQNVTGGTSPAVVTNDRSVANSIWLGDIQYQDINHDGKVDTKDQTALGNPNPDFTYSITNNFNYKDFELSIFLNGSYGGKILNALRYQTEGLSGLYQNQTAASANFWTPSNPNSNIPAPRAGIANNNLVMSDRFLESASFLRIQNVRLGYNLPAKWAHYAKLNHLKVYASGQNLYVFTKYTGLDPEIGSLNQSPILQNIDNGRYPIPRTVIFGLNAEF
ncbi:TonB-dependent receptor [Mucilaginibacter sp. BJC16-A38]|uniref:SusC/RagA family TonB-linked outer membrane protein n=1 Tax=Mucilaginibacter phenanthrenivorans TaxID=1234842 RepID=UPI00215856EB|nr:TonB-dependent receptor [Mucilaginibacter phenanthrenivorans]MCR8558067.1 TonB-dependent receptor [Mucilaginibacter phenanthrenivorans]